MDLRLNPVPARATAIATPQPATPTYQVVRDSHGDRIETLLSGFQACAGWRSHDSSLQLWSVTRATGTPPWPSTAAESSPGSAGDAALPAVKGSGLMVPCNVLTV